jgi:hypothetical protein
MAELCKKIDDVLVDRLSAAVRDALIRVGVDHGLVVHVGRITYSENNIHFDVEAMRVDPSGVPLGRDAEEFLRRAEDFGLKASDLGRTFGDGHKLKIAGLRPRRKDPVICHEIEPPTGRAYFVPARAVRAGLADADRQAARHQPPRPESEAAIRAAVLRLVEGARDP